MIQQHLRALLLCAALAGAVLIAPLRTAAQQQPAAPAAVAQVDPHAIPVTGTVPNNGTFAGTLDISSFAVQNGRLVALGTLAGTLKDASGEPLGTLAQVPVTLPVANITGSCDVLNVVLDSLSLNLLGLQVELHRVVLDIFAQAGPGNLLGNLLCAVVNLLNTNGPLSSIADLLNVILSYL